MAKAKKKRKTKPKLTAKTADRHVLYGLSVQNVEAEIDFVEQTFESLRGRKAGLIREDFCGTANSACEWVRRRRGNRAVGVDLCAETLAWAREHNLSTLSDEERGRVTLLERDVRDPGPGGRGADVVLAMNFSYWIFKQRAEMVGYFRSVRESLGKGGVFILDHYGGSDALTETEEDREIDGFTYVWDQHRYNPINGDMTCYIHFKFPDGTKMKRAFEYHWRHYTLPEIRDCLLDAGFRTTIVYWEGEDEDGEGNGEFAPAEEGDADMAFITYIVAEP
jgi:SAM-dependent methyltransferase